MGAVAILVMWPVQLVYILANIHKESSYEIWVQLTLWFLRKLCFNVLMGLQYERPLLKSYKVELDLDLETYL